MLLLPKKPELEEIVEKMKKLSPEELAEVMQIMANKKIKVIAVDKE